MSEFAEYARSTAFNISLTQRMCQTLLVLRRGGLAGDSYSHWLNTLKALRDRGLVVLNQSTDPKERGWKLTKPGELVAELVELAEFQIVSSTEDKAA